ncbi:hypothetical protein [Flexithrix dorotheae]|uniref:hypothetical protein n=1 Tax=Flexithrix dorotheae TaxID=70993 RepID=UPI000368393E|nr:hypothetical protein [Flexithrix dorotheae]
MKIKVLIIYLATFLFATIWQSCENDPCNSAACECGELEDEKPYYEITDQRSTLNGYFDSDDVWRPTQNAKDPVKPDRFGIYVEMEYDFVAALENKAGSSGLSFFPNANACTLSGPGWKGTKQEIVSINVTSKNDFDDSKTKGALLNEFFDIYPFQPENRNNLASKENLSDFLLVKPGALKEFTLLLKQTPAYPDQEFVITYALSNGDVYEINAKPISFSL